MHTKKLQKVIGGYLVTTWLVTLAQQDFERPEVGLPVLLHRFRKSGSPVRYGSVVDPEQAEIVPVLHELHRLLDAELVKTVVHFLDLANFGLSALAAKNGAVLVGELDFVLNHVVRSDQAAEVVQEAL